MSKFKCEFQPFVTHPDYLGARRIFWLLTSLHVLIWTLLPTLMRASLPMDSLEAATWSQHLAFGYDKNPYLNAWLVHAIIALFGYHDWVIYAAAKLFILLCFYSVWRLSHYFLTPLQALLAVFMLEGLQYFTIAAVEFNDNVLELGLWAAMIVCCYEVIQHNRMPHWLLLGLVTGLGLMSKYYTLIPVACLLYCLFTSQAAHRVIKSTGFYLAILIAVAVCLPHVHWLIMHQFVTIRYAQTSIGHGIHWYDHIYQPCRFLIVLLFSCLGPLLMLCCCGNSFISSWHARTPLTRESQRFIVFASFMPLAMTLGIAAITGGKLRMNWGQPLLSFWGLWLMAYMQPAINWPQMYRFLSGLLVVFLGFTVSYAASLYQADVRSSAHFPAKQFAQTVEKKWHSAYRKALPWLLGDRQLTGRIAFYGQDKPEIILNKQIWHDPSAIHRFIARDGGVVVWQNQSTLPRTLHFLADLNIDIQAIDIGRNNENTGAVNPVYIGIIAPGQIKNPYDHAGTSHNSAKFNH